MSRYRIALLCLLILSVLIAPAAVQTVTAQAQPWLQVWAVPGENWSVYSLEYRDAAGQVLASYVINDLTWPRHAGGRLYGTALENIPVFDPYAGTVAYQPVTGKLQDTDQDFYLVMDAIPAPDGQTYAYTISVQHSDYTLQALSTIYIGHVGQAGDRQLLQVQMEPSHALSPMGWADNGNILLLHLQPIGIGGYILFWTYQDVQLYDLRTNAVVGVGDVDGYSEDGRKIARVILSDGPARLEILDVASGTTAGYNMPNLGEAPRVGGGAIFSPSGMKVAYQVARGEPDNEKYWTLLTDLQTGLTTILL
ncbi:MAG: hypothetical protein JW910_12070, partial [Anaerolineae bacterium]|nr:hypothetical protein [Anaerolineae bacterium]